MHDALSRHLVHIRRGEHHRHRRCAPDLRQPGRRLRQGLRDSHRRHRRVVRPYDAPAPRHRRGRDDVRRVRHNAREPRHERPFRGLGIRVGEPESVLHRIVVVRVRLAVATSPHAAVAIVVDDLAVRRDLPEAVGGGGGHRVRVVLRVVGVVERLERMGRREHESGRALGTEGRIDAVGEHDAVDAHRPLPLFLILHEDERLRAVGRRQVAPERVDDPPRRPLCQERMLVVRVEAHLCIVVLVVDFRGDRAFGGHKPAVELRRAG